jgi:aspartate/methionine/tyrosine aminotransferase
MYGEPALIDAIATRYGVLPECVVPVPGTSSANFIALAVSVSHGETVMIERPAYDPFGRIARFLGLKVLPLERPPAEAFGVTIEAVAAGLEHGARAVVITNLHNPGGRCLSRDTIREIARTCGRAGATLIVDEVYLDSVAITEGGKPWTAAGCAPNVITTSSLTKVYGLGGLRAGWVIGQEDVIARACNVMDLLSVVNAVPAAALAIEAFVRMDVLEARYRWFHEEGQAAFRAWLRGEPLVTGYENHGALFECVRLPEGLDADRFSAYLVTHHDTCVVPGSFFGLPGHVRIGLAPSTGGLDEGLSRLSAALRAYPSAVD